MASQAPAGAGAGAGAPDGDAPPAGLLGRLMGGGGARFKKAKMGLELKMYYNEEVGRDPRARPPPPLPTPALTIAPSLPPSLCSSRAGASRARRTRSGASWRRARRRRPRP
jgi:hypothetical protein